MLDGRRPHTGGWHFEWVVPRETREELPSHLVEQQLSLKDERWEEVVVDGSGTGCYVSNLGRFQNSIRVFTPRPNEGCTYARVKIGGDILLFHRVVLTAFEGECPNGCSGGEGVFCSMSNRSCA